MEHGGEKRQNATFVNQQAVEVPNDLKFPLRKEETEEDSRGSSISTSCDHGQANKGKGRRQRSVERELGGSNWRILIEVVRSRGGGSYRKRRAVTYWRKFLYESSLKPSFSRLT